MEFNEKLQEMRKQRGLTQEELANALFVSRTAVSKWESGRGYPNIDSLRAIASFFSVSVDELLSGNEILNLAEEDSKDKKNQLSDIVFGVFDLSVIVFLFLPFFAEKVGNVIHEVSLIAIREIQPYLVVLYYIVTICIVLCGIFTLALQSCHCILWDKYKKIISLLLNTAGALLFILSSQVYPAIFLFFFLSIKVILLLTRKVSLT